MPLRDVVALDGPSGTGKSTVAKALAVELGLRYLNTGAMYRAVAWAVLRAAIDPADAARVGRLAGRVRIDISTDPHDQRVTVDGEAVGEEIRSAEVTVAVSPVSATPEVRRLLVAQQRELIGAGGIVVEGRDIGTVVAPEAPLKVYLTASHDTRAERRARQDGAAPEQLGATSDALRRRDAYDSGRTVAPLRPADDAVHVDTTMLAVYDVVKRLVDIARDRGIAQTALVPVPDGEER
ncbi:MAG: CMP/dCMP kinase [Mycobacteriales bacterium]